MFTPEQIPGFAKAIANTGRILIVSVDSLAKASEVKKALIGMEGEVVESYISDLYDNPSMLSEERTIVLADATNALTSNTNGEFLHFMSLAQRRNYKAAVVAIVTLDSYDSHAAQYCVNVRVG